MKSFAALVITAIVLAAVGGLLWLAGDLERRRAGAEYTLVTLRYDRAVQELDAAAASGVLDPILRLLSPGAEAERAVATYWSGDYQPLTTSADPSLKLLAANAAYRALRASGGPWQSVVGRLDSIAKRYADVLRTQPDSEEAAYNYEFVLRMRAGVMKGRQPLVAGDSAFDALTVHGQAGAPPQDSDAKKFRMIVPMLPDERQEAEEAGRVGAESPKRLTPRCQRAWIWPALRFAAPAYLLLLWVPALLLVVWVWQAWRRRSDVLQMRRHRQLPERAAHERLPLLGDLAFWLCMIVALVGVLAALARPVGVASMIRTSGIDLVVLQDGSASMRVRDVRGDRWRRSMIFLRTLGESLQWEDDRVALALFATIATPQIRLTRDPNTFFFFLDHLEDEPPFRLEDDTTWDTNIERGIYWGMRLIDRDEEMKRGQTRRRPDPGARR